MQAFVKKISKEMIRLYSCSRIMTWPQYERTVMVSNDKLEGDLVIPVDAKAIILFAHGSGSSRCSIRNRYVARILNEAGFATLLIDLLTSQEKEIDEKIQHLRFDIDLLAKRFSAVTQWLIEEPETSCLKIGYFGSSTGAAAALIAAVKFQPYVNGIVLRGGRLDLDNTKNALQLVRTPTLLIVGGDDSPMIKANREALKQLTNTEKKKLVIIPGATHLFEESGKMEEVAKVATQWFEDYLLDIPSQHDTSSNFNSGDTNELISGLKARFTLQVKFKDRSSAGEMLASILKKYKKRSDDITVIGIPRGGIIVAHVVANKLSANNFDVVLPRKLKAHNNPERAVGAIMQDGSVYLDTALTDSLHISNKYIETESLREKMEIDRMMAMYRPDPREYRIRGSTVFLIDDGIATGATITVAARWIRKHQPKRLIISVPVAPSHIIKKLRSEADFVEVLKSPSRLTFGSVDQFYMNFTEVPEDKVSEILKVWRR